MQYCERCKVQIAGDRDFCPLCQGQLQGRGDPAMETYPVVPFARHVHRPLINTMLFLSIAAVVICAAFNYIFYNGRVWTLFVAAGIASMWVSLSSAILRRHNLPKNILWQVFWLSVLALLWDLLTGWRHWALDYAVPILCICAMLVMAILAKMLRLPAEDYMVYLILVGLFGILPILFLAFGWVRVIYPSVVCVAASILSLAALLSFQGDKLLAEAKKRLHL